MPKEPPVHIRLLNLLSAIRELSPFNTMTADEELLLDDLIVRWHGARSVKMSDLLNDDGQTSRTTAYRRLMSLRDKGLIVLEDDPDDKRAKFVIPAEHAQAYVKLVQSGVDQLLSGKQTK